jgi:hypothetical protein
LKDHPEKDGKHIAASLKEPYANISNTLNTMWLRGMVSKLKYPGRSLLWSVTNPNEGFQLRPKITKAEKEKQVAATDKNGKPEDTVKGLKTGTDFDKAFEALATKPRLDVAKLPLQEAHEVYLQLKSYFEPKVL